MGVWVGVQAIEKLEYLFEWKLLETYKIVRFIEAKSYRAEQTQRVMAVNIKANKRQEANWWCCGSSVANKVNLIW